MNPELPDKIVIDEATMAEVYANDPHLVKLTKRMDKWERILSDRKTDVKSRVDAMNAEIREAQKRVTAGRNYIVRLRKKVGVALNTIKDCRESRVISACKHARTMRKYQLNERAAKRVAIVTRNRAMFEATEAMKAVNRKDKE